MKRSLDGGRLGGTGWPRGGRALIAGRGYDPDKPRASSGDGVEATISRSQTDSGSSGLGTVRWVSSPVHLAAFVRELRLRWERLAASTEPFMSLGFAVAAGAAQGLSDSSYPFRMKVKSGRASSRCVTRSQLRVRVTDELKRRRLGL